MHNAQLKEQIQNSKFKEQRTKNRKQRTKEEIPLRYACGMENREQVTGIRGQETGDSQSESSIHNSTIKHLNNQHFNIILIWTRRRKNALLSAP